MINYTDVEKIAFHKALVVTAMADGKIHPREYHYIQGIIEFLDISQSLLDLSSNMKTEEAYMIIQRMSYQKKLILVKAVTDLAEVDGDVHDYESDFIVALLHLTGITPQELYAE